MESITRTIIVTGSNKGIGFGIVEILCRRDNIPNIIMACRSKERAEASKAKLEEAYPKAKGKLTIILLEVGVEKSMLGFVNEVKEKFGEVDCLVNNAGIAINVDENNEELSRKTA